jgi:2Fe-2S ferredoxin
VPAVTFIDAAGQAFELEVPSGETLMRAAVRANVTGIEAACGGGLSCATCHVHVAPEWAARLPEPSPDELAMLDFVEAPRTQFSRLSCQLYADEAIDGLTVKVPAI